MHFVYILKSLKTSGFYIGETYEINQRLVFHNDPILNEGSTKKSIPWELYLLIEVKNRAVARKIKSHVKKMKSKTYIENLKQYEEMRLKIIDLYTNY